MGRMNTIYTLLQSTARHPPHLVNHLHKKGQQQRVYLHQKSKCDINICTKGKKQTRTMWLQVVDLNEMKYERLFFNLKMSTVILAEWLVNFFYY